MNICFFIGKIISDVDFEFIIHNRKNISIVKFEIELENKSKIIIEGYNEIADFCYSHLNKNDKIILQGYLKTEKEVVLENIQLIMSYFERNFTRKIKVLKEFTENYIDKNKLR